ncbi:MAG TPA: glucokinase [Candidatus Eisenbacteria bacterium]
MILAGDVGGTKTNLAWFEARGRGRIGPPHGARSYRSADFASLASLVSAFRREEPGSLEAASFGIAGAVVGDRVTGPNLPWRVDGAALAREVGVPRVHLVNDLAATGYGIASLPPASLEPLQTGRPAEDANVGLLAAGTGLGETILVRQGAELVPVPSEGGHADFAPRTDREIGVFRALRERFGRVSYERVLSGPGLVHVAEALHLAAGAASAWTAHEVEAGGRDPSEGVSGRGLAGTCPLCREALELFVEVYGAEAGNLALRGLTLGGVYLGGGIAPKILPALAAPRFLEAFRSKDPVASLLQSIPVHVILEERTAMLGAARYATLQ